MINNQTFTYHMKEYDSLHAEIVHVQSQIFQLIRFTLGAAFLIYAWAATNTIGVNDGIGPCAKFSASITGFLWFMPTLIALIGGIICDRSIRHINNIGNYLERLDNYFLQNDLGWHKRSQYVPMRDFGINFNILCWIAIVVVFASIAIGAFIYYNSLNTCM